MISLRGKLERVKKQPATCSLPVSVPQPEATATITAAEPTGAEAAAKTSPETQKPESSDSTPRGAEEYEWTWTGHWAFGFTMPDDSKKLQPFYYKFEKEVDPSQILVTSLNFASSENDEEEEQEDAAKSENDGKTSEKIVAPPQQSATTTPAIKMDHDKTNEKPADNPEKTEKSRLPKSLEAPTLDKEEGPHNQKSNGDTKENDSVTTTRAKETPAEADEKTRDKEKTFGDEAASVSTSNDKTKEAGPESSVSKETATLAKSTEGDKKLVSIADSEGKISNVADLNDDAKDEENVTKASEKKEGTILAANTQKKEETGDKTEKWGDSSQEASDRKESQVAPSVTDSTIPKREKITFATPLSPDDPPFTDASKKHPEKCPVGGQWTGYFENKVKASNKRRGHQAAPVIQKIEEIFHIYLNATPPKEASIWFLPEDPSAKKRKTDLTKDENAGILREGLFHVRGTGENQFGTFELLGSFDVETGILECQRMYVANLEEPKPVPRRQSRSARGVPDPIPSTLTPSGSSEGRPYFTRKRQPSWKRRSSFGVDDSDSGEEAPPRRRSSSTGAGASSGKRVRVAEPTKAEAATSTLVPALNSQGGVSQGLTIDIPKVVAPGRKPGPSPKTGGTPRSRKSGTGSASSTPREPKQQRGTPVSATTTQHMRLPAVGEPKMAVWRAAHYLYYQKNDPSLDEGTGGGYSTSSGPNTAAGNAFKYVVYEGEIFHSQREGRGVCLYNNQMIYEGEWKKNKEHGRGTLMTSDRKRIIYHGEWERGRMHGRGTYYYPNSKQQSASSDDGRGKKKSNISSSADVIQSRYEGDFKENLRHGYGKYVLPDGSIYEGMWRENMMCGRGVFTWPDGSIYDGEWKDGRRHGSGLLRVSDGFSYDGMWVQNAMEGRGTAVYPNGQIYNGMFSNGCREGRGTIHFPNGACLEGRFRHDNAEGQGTMKIAKLTTVPRPKKRKYEPQMKNEDETSEREINKNDDNTEKGEEDEVKPDFMIPLSFQSDMGHIHQKAGFTVMGD